MTHPTQLELTLDGVGRIARKPAVLTEAFRLTVAMDVKEAIIRTSAYLRGLTTGLHFCRALEDKVQDDLELRLPSRVGSSSNILSEIEVIQMDSLSISRVISLMQQRRLVWQIPSLEPTGLFTLSMRGRLYLMQAIA